MWRKAPVLILAILLVASVSVQPSLGQKYPTKPIEIMLPYSPGSSIDILSRLVAETAPKYLGQPVVVVTKPGGGGSVAAADVISSKPDGYKLLCAVNFLFSITTKTQKIPFDPDHLEPLATLFELKQGLCIKGDAPWKTLGDLLDYGRKNPGKIRWAHTGRGSGAHIPILLMFKKAGVETIDIPHKGAPEMISAIMGSHIEGASIPYGAIRDHVRSGQMRYLVFFTDNAYGDPPGIPTALELGFPEVARMPAQGGYFIHKDTPEEIKKTLVDALKKISDDPGFKKGFEKTGENLRFGGPEFARESIRKSEEVGVPILKELGLYIAK